MANEASAHTHTHLNNIAIYYSVKVISLAILDSITIYSNLILGSLPLTL